MSHAFGPDPSLSSPQGQAVTPRATWRDGLGDVVAGLHTSREVTHNIRHNGRIRQLPSQAALLKILARLSSALFPTHYGATDLIEESIDGFVETALREGLDLLEDQVRRDLLSSTLYDDLTASEVNDKAGDILARFALTLPEIRALLVSDLMAAFAGDPAAKSYPEIMLGYPGLIAIRYYRIARALYDLGATLLARLISQIAHQKTAIDIHPGAQIGHSFFIDHGTGVVIGETAIIGDRVRIYQAVTLGAKSFQADDDGTLVKGILRHPVVENDVVIYAGATILGRITIGAGSVIGGNVWLTQSVPQRSSITQALMRKSEAGVSTAG
ncbi:serine O-acetyltransferase EpsC [Lichenihabitans psoromatis]|uniref:serine O-acetyltransferase EpsC n=1 Tax=Lichenihabitans psoromatis TaxID=2528642 RepID=UPI0010384EED|nr:serine O-acetyltransferase EpsC [Lichenihabitans psoromatis]